MTADGYGACYALLEGRINIGVGVGTSTEITDCAKFARTRIEGRSATRWRCRRRPHQLTAAVEALSLVQLGLAVE